MCEKVFFERGHLNTNYQFFQKLTTQLQLGQKKWKHPFSQFLVMELSCYVVKTKLTESSHKTTQ